MVRQKGRTQILLLKRKLHGKAKGKNSILTFKKKSHGKAKARNSILLFEQKKTSHGKAKGKNSILTFEQKKSLGKAKEIKSHGKAKGKKSIPCLLFRIMYLIGDISCVPGIKSLNTASIKNKTLV